MSEKPVSMYLSLFVVVFMFLFFSVLLAGTFVYGYTFGVERSVTVEQMSDNKYRGVLNGLLQEARWSHDNIISLKELVGQPSLSTASSAS